MNFALRVILFAGGPVASRGGIDGNTPLFPAPRAMPVAAKGERRRLVAALNAVATELGFLYFLFKIFSFPRGSRRIAPLRLRFRPVKNETQHSPLPCLES